MARITIEDCLRRVKNRFMLVHAAAKRVRQIREGAQYLVHSPKNEDIVIALRELGAGRVKVEKEELEEEVAEEAKDKVEEKEAKEEAATAEEEAAPAEKEEAAAAEKEAEKPEQD